MSVWAAGDDVPGTMSSMSTVDVVMIDPNGFLHGNPTLLLLWRKVIIHVEDHRR
jgi:hypothetical protein